MIIVVDANIIISALLGSQTTIYLIIDENFKYLAPEVIISEIKKHKEEISHKASNSPEEFDVNLNALLVFIETIGMEEYENYLEKAKEVMKDRDIKDADYIACALAKNAKLIWTNDKDFTSQNLVRCKTTKELLVLKDKIKIFKFKKTSEEILKEE